MTVTLPVRRTVAAVALAGSLGLSTLMGVIPANAQSATATAPANAAHPHHLNMIQKHPTMTGIAAGVATHHALKVAAARDKARGKRLNFAERHPTMSALGVGMVTHHEIKKHTPH